MTVLSESEILLRKSGHFPSQYEPDMFAFVQYGSTDWPSTENGSQNIMATTSYGTEKSRGQGKGWPVGTTCTMQVDLLLPLMQSRLVFANSALLCFFFQTDVNAQQPDEEVRERTEDECTACGDNQWTQCRLHQKSWDTRHWAVKWQLLCLCNRF